MRKYNVVVRATVDNVIPVEATSQKQAQEMALEQFKSIHRYAFMPEVSSIQDGETFEPLEVEILN